MECTLGALRISSIQSVRSTRYRGGESIVIGFCIAELAPVGTKAPLLISKESFQPVRTQNSEKLLHG